MSKKFHWSFQPYHFIVTLPDRLYPFKSDVRGEWVRGTKSYNAALARSYRRYGAGHYGYGLSLYRQLFHFTGSLLIMYGAAYVSYNLLGSRTTLIIILTLTSLFITYQEFFLQRRVYRQLWRKAVADWCVWCVPMGLYLFLFR